MSELRDWLESKQADLTSSLGTTISSADEARRLSQIQISAFVLALAAATEEGPDVMELLLEQWQAENSLTGSPGRWIGTVGAIREGVWAHIVSEFSAAKALHHLRTLDHLLAEVSLVAADLDTRERVQELDRLLIGTREQLRRLEHSKSDFIKIAAHELKTPLTLIEGYANMLMSAIPEQARPKTDILLGGIANGTRRLGEIIEGMIDVSMIDIQVLDISFQPLFLRQLLKAVVEDLGPVLRIRQIEMTVDPLPEDGAPTFGDSERLYQAIYNVVGNAIKFTPDNGRIMIRNSIVEAERENPKRPGRFLDLQIADTGIGIDRENLERIFEKFVGLGIVALHSTGKYKFKGGGPGLGLAISKGIIEAHGGKIWAESEGHDEIRCPGSTFHLLVPLYDRAPTPLEPSPEMGKAQVS